MLTNQQTEDPVQKIERVISREELLEAQALVRQIRVSEVVKDYIVEIVRGTRNNSRIRMGVSPRGTLAFLRAAQAHAAISGRDYVIPDDVKAVAPDVLSHRILCKGSSLSQGGSLAKAALEQVLAETHVPIE